MYLFTEPDNKGKRQHFRTSQRALPADFDATAQSILVTKIPVWVFDQPNFGGRRVLFNRRGGCNDLAACVPGGGNWRNRIRSISFGEGIGLLAEDEVVENIGLSDEPLPKELLREIE